MKSKKNGRLIARWLAILLLAITAAMLVVGSQRREAAQRGAAHAAARSYALIRSASDAIQLLAVEKPRQLNMFIETNQGRFDGQRFFDAFVKDPENFLAVAERWSTAQSVVDAWDQPLNFAAKPIFGGQKNAADAYRIRIWSNGPDKTNDNATGDDLLGEAFSIGTN